MAKNPKHPMIYDYSNDAERPVTQDDIVNLVKVSQKLGDLRADLLKLMVVYFPTLAEDLALAAQYRGQLNAEFYRANGRHPKDMAEARAHKAAH
jgi:hypothetical protein